MNPSGMEMMMRSMGLGSVLDAAKELAESGAVQKIVQFANDAEAIRNDLAQIKAKLGIEDVAGLIEGTARTVEPGSGSTDRDVA